MKKILLLFVAIATMSACSKDEETTPKNENLIIGSWELTHFNDMAIKDFPDIFDETTIITFKKGGAYEGKGAFGNGSGTYEIKGDVVTTYIEGEKFHTFEIVTIDNQNVEAKMTDSSGTTTIKAKRI